jgi:primary-amine oxidase
MIISDPNPSFTFTPGDEYQISWQGWAFRYGYDTTFAMILREITVLDRTVNYENPVIRDLIYRMNISELITGYASNVIPSKGRNFFDVREFPAREFMSQLKPVVDVPPYAKMLPAVFTYADGSTLEVENVIAVYKQDGGVSWRHNDYSCSGAINIRGRRNRQLVITYTLVVGNYDYPVYYIFNQDFSLEIEVGLTEVLETDGVNKTKVTYGQDGIETGTLIHRYIEAPNHWHAMSLRMDVCIDGEHNTVHEADTILLPVSDENPCGNIFVEKHTVLPSVKKAIRKWVIHNPNSKTDLGHSRAYELVPAPVAHPFSNPQSRIGKRTLYLQHTLFVTQYADDEFYVTGKYPVENCKDEGLAKYTREDKNLVNQDVVLWHTTGLAHSPVVE